MKTNIIAVTGIGLLILFVVGFASLLEIRIASAQVDASSSIPLITDATPTTLVVDDASSSPLAEADASSTPEVAPPNDAATTIDTADSTGNGTTTVDETPASIIPTPVSTSTLATSTRPVKPPPQGLTLVHIIGVKYIDYFTDGSSTIPFPGNPDIDSHFDVPNAQAPTREGLTWVHTTSQHLYDTPSGDLEVGDYAIES